MAVRAWNDDGSELRVPTVTESDITDQTFTFAALVKPGDKTDWEAIMSARDTVHARTAWAFGMSSSDKPFYLVTQASGSAQTVQPATGGVLTNGQWYILAFTAAPLRTFHIYNLGTDTWTHVGGDIVGDVDAAQASAFIEFGHDIDNAFALKARMALAAIWDSALSDAQIEALGEHLATSDWTTHAVAPAGLWSFTQATAGDDVSDVMGNHDTITGSITGDSDTVGRTGTAVITGEDPPGWDLTIPAPVLSVELRLSGGSANENPSLSIGGAVSSYAAADVFDSVSSMQAVTGLTDYRLVYVLNADVADGNIQAYVSAQLATPGHSIALGPASEPAGTPVTPITSDTAPPPGVTFDAPTTLGAAVDCGNVAPGDMKGIWLQRIVPPDAADSSTDPWAVTFEVDPL